MLSFIPILLLFAAVIAAPSVMLAFIKEFKYPAFLEANFDIKLTSIVLLVLAIIIIAISGVILILYIKRGDEYYLWDLGGYGYIFYFVFLLFAFIVSYFVRGKAAIKNLRNYESYSIYTNTTLEEYFGKFFFDRALNKGCNDSYCIIEIIQARYKKINIGTDAIMYLLLVSIILLIIECVYFASDMSDEDQCRLVTLLLFIFLMFSTAVALPIYMLGIFGRKTFNNVCLFYGIKDYKNYLIPSLGLVGWMFR